MTGHSCATPSECTTCDGLALLAWLEGMETMAPSIPVQAEDRAKGASIFNWHMHFIRQARCALENDRAARRQKLHVPPALCPF